MEPCDFLSTHKQFIHLKDGHSSAPISHLWNQGVVAAEAFVRDEKFRVDLRKAVKKRQRQAKKKGFEALVPPFRRLVLCLNCNHRRNRTPKVFDADSASPTMPCVVILL